MATLRFSADPVQAKTAIAVVFDVAGFSTFCNHPDRHNHVPKFVAALFDALDALTVNEIDYGLFPPQIGQPKIIVPDFIKYTGDGALMLWVSDNEKRFSQQFRNLLVATMRRFQREFALSAGEREATWCVNDLPSQIRFGIAMGSVFPLHEASGLFRGGVLDYAGYCINLASRLQNHCPDVGFSIQKCVAPEISDIECFTAIGMKGTAEESIWLFREDFQPLEQEKPKYWKTKYRRG